MVSFVWIKILLLKLFNPVRIVLARVEWIKIEEILLQFNQPILWHDTHKETESDR